MENLRDGHFWGIRVLRSTREWPFPLLEQTEMKYLRVDALLHY